MRRAVNAETLTRKLEVQFLPSEPFSGPKYVAIRCGIYRTIYSDKNIVLLIEITRPPDMRAWILQFGARGLEIKLDYIFVVTSLAVGPYGEITNSTYSRKNLFCSGVEVDTRAIAVG